MIRLLLAATALIALIALARWLGRANANQRSRTLKQILLYGASAILLLLVITAVDVSVGQVIDSAATFSLDWGKTFKVPCTRVAYHWKRVL